MNPERYRKAGEIYHAALALPESRRAAFLERSCAGDPELLGEVESLLVAHGDADAARFIDGPEPDAWLEADRPDTTRTGPFEISGGTRPVEATLVAGQHVGRYEVLDLLGSGGMGSVYRALDPDLGREVAIKALAHTFRDDSVNLRRFEREARVLASLSHPNIATIYGVEQMDGAPYLVLEHVEGETLADRLLRGALPLDAALEVAVQIVAGLEEAHAKGVVHRDLKPSNVMLAAGGRVKLVDFGLAKVTAPPPATAASPEAITAPHVVVGTARYMSPEQVKAEPVDSRTDVWAFGCVLYEMLTGRPAFLGRSVPEVVAGILRDDVSWEGLPAGTPPRIVRLLRRCLRRDPRQRLQHVGDARLDLLEDDEPAAVGAAAGRGATGKRTTWALAAVALAALGGLALVWLRPAASRTAVPLARLSLELPARIGPVTDYSPPFAIAPAGSPVVLEGLEGTERQLYVRDIADPTLRALPGTEGALQPFFSPDGASVAFFANRKLLKIPVAGGPVLQVADIGSNSRGGSWAPDGTIVFAAPQTAGLSRVAASGGRPTPLTTLDKGRGESSHRWPEVLPGGRWVLFTVGFEDAPYDEGRIDAVSLESGERRQVVAGAGFARYLPEGQLLFVRGGLVYRIGFDPGTLATRGAPEVVLGPIRYDFRNGGSHLAVSASGAVLYGPGESISNDYFVAWVDRDGRLARAVDVPRPFREVRASPDGRRIAAVIGTSTESDLWLVDDNNTLSRLASALAPHRPTWTSDGTGITIGAETDGKWRLVTLAANGKDEPRVLVESDRRLYPNAWSPDGRYLVFQESGLDSGWDLRVLEVDADGRPLGAPRPLANTPFHEASAAISPDGRWIAYESNELDGVFQVYAQSFPDGAHKVRTSTSGARWPEWDARGTLHYWMTTDDTLRAVRTTAQGGVLTVGAPEVVWRDPTQPALRRIVNPVAGARFDLDPTGTRFLVLETAGGETLHDLSSPVVVLGGLQPRQP